MSNVRIEQIRVPDTLDGDDAADFLTAVEVSRQVRISTWGNDDLAYTAEEMLHVCHDPFEWYVVLAAWLDDELVGRAGIAMPLDDQTELAHVTLDILPQAQGHGLGRILLEAAETYVRGENRHVVMVETNHAAVDLDGDIAESLPAANGVGRLPLESREARFAHRAGYQLEQVEQFSVCALPVAVDLLAKLAAQAKTVHGEDYILHQWMDVCPPEWAPEIVRLEQGANGDVDVPWDVTRLREVEELSAQTGRHTLVTAAERRDSGTLVAFTSISVLGNRDDVVFQDDTIVETAHRGRELGLRIKAANLELLAKEFPAASNVYTWNAPDNAYMLSVNADLGFVAAGVSGQWHKDFRQDV